jgi:hypothetical protein
LERGACRQDISFGIKQERRHTVIFSRNAVADGIGTTVMSSEDGVAQEDSARLQRSL